MIGHALNGFVEATPDLAPDSANWHAFPSHPGSDASRGTRSRALKKRYTFVYFPVPAWKVPNSDVLLSGQVTVGTITYIEKYPECFVACRNRCWMREWLAFRGTRRLAHLAFERAIQVQARDRRARTDRVLSSR
jgi:hypothetical protein